MCLVEPWMQSVDVILIPSLFESFGYVAVEAMMLSCPLIVSKTGGLVDVVGHDYGYFFLPNNAVMLADVMASMALNPNAEAVAANYQRAKTLFLASTMLNGIMAVYQRLYQRSKG